MNRKKFGLAISIIVLLIVSGLFIFKLNRNLNSQKYINSHTATIFVHGWGSNYTAETHMANAAKYAGVTNTIIRANVSKRGKVQFLGNINKKDRNPIVEVNLTDNKTPEGTESNSKVIKLYHHSGDYIRNVVTALKNQFHVKSINFVGHSMGNLLISYYILDSLKNHSMPIINHQVVIAGHYDGIKDMQPYSLKSKLTLEGYPSVITPEYKGLLRLRKTFPKQIKVLNIYGDIGDKYHSDGEVTITSAKSYRYLAHNATVYSEDKITRNAQHSQLHENNSVDKKIISFLWKK